MNRKRFIKKMMGLGFSRNFARKSAELLQQMNLEAQAMNRRQMRNYSWLLAREKMMRNLDEWSEYTAIKRRRKADEAENGDVDFLQKSLNIFVTNSSI